MEHLLHTELVTSMQSRMNMAFNTLDEEGDREREERERESFA